MQNLCRTYAELTQNGKICIYITTQIAIKLYEIEAALHAVFVQILQTFEKMFCFQPHKSIILTVFVVCVSVLTLF